MSVAFGAAPAGAAVRSRPVAAEADGSGLFVTHVVRRLASQVWGGVETVVVELCAALARRGVATEICCTKALAPVAFEVIHGTPVRRFAHVYPYLFQTAAGRRALDDLGGNPIVPGLYRHLLRNGADLYHAGVVGRLGAAVRLAARLRRVPYVVSLHASTEGMTPAMLKELGRAPGMRLDVGRILHPLLNQRRVLADAAHILCLGQSQLAEVTAAHPCVPVTLLPNGVDTMRFASGQGCRFREAFGLRGEPLLLCVARIGEAKNQRLLVRALPTIAERHPGVHAVFLGAAAEADYLELLRDEIRERGLGERVTIVPGLAYDDPLLADAYAAADLFVLPSTYEAFGVVVLEAWSAGAPVVAARVGGLASLVEEGRTGLFFLPGDARALAEAALAVLGDPGRARSLGEAGRREARERYSWDAHAERTLAVYESVLARWRR